jgi:hypothetical protein
MQLPLKWPLSAVAAPNSLPRSDGLASERAGHHLFFRGGIAVVLTLGAAWGALLLLRVASAGSFTAASLQEVNAHGHAQIFGWVGLFVMGVACFRLAWIKGVPAVSPGVARACFWLMLVGLTLRSLSQGSVDLAPWLLYPAVVGSVLEIVAIVGVGGIVITTIRAAGRVTPADAFVVAAFGWFLLQAVYGTIYFVATTQADSREGLVSLVATWQAPLREMQIHGFAMLMIFGVSQWILPKFYGFPRTTIRRSWTALILINVGLIGMCVGLVLMRQFGHAWAGLWYVSVAIMTGGIVPLVLGFGVWRSTRAQDRSLKYVRAAYSWLLVSLAMLVALPLYQFVLLASIAPASQAVEIGFSHAYYGAIRHAITVGFISLMIMGMAARMVSEPNALRYHLPQSLWLPWLLVNAGCTSRVLGQITTDFTSLAFVITGMSGLLELTGLAIWGAHIWVEMSAAKSSGRGSQGTPFKAVKSGESRFVTVPSG